MYDRRINDFYEEYMQEYMSSFPIHLMTNTKLHQSTLINQIGIDLFTYLCIERFNNNNNILLIRSKTKII